MVTVVRRVVVRVVDAPKEDEGRFVVVHQGEVVVYCVVLLVVVGSNDDWGIPAAPVSIVAIINGGTGVTGRGGLVQSFPLGAGVSNRPRARLILRSKGKGSRQQRFEKSSRSTVQAAMPPYPPSITYFVFKEMASASSNPTH